MGENLEFRFYIELFYHNVILSIDNNSGGCKPKYHIALNGQISSLHNIITNYFNITIIKQLQCWSLENRQNVSLFSLSNLGQIGIPITVLESACPEDSKTPPECWIWWSIGWDIEGFAHLVSFQKLTSFH